MFLFASGRAHMSGYTRLWFFLAIVFNIGIGFAGIRDAPIESFDWALLFYGISSLICATGLIILLSSFRVGGSIALIGNVIQFVCASFLNENYVLFQMGSKWGFIIVFFIVHIILVLAALIQNPD